MTRKRRSAHTEDGGDSEDRWFLTYSDMITLLLALFVVLFALSTMNQRKFAEFRTGVRHAFTSQASPISKGSQGLLHQTSLVNHAGKVTPRHTQQQSSSATSASPSTTVVSRVNSAQLAQLEQEIHTALGRQGLLPYVNMTLTKTSLTVGLVADKVFFATNSDALGAAGVEVVNTVGHVLAPGSNNVVVQGGTDNVPVTGGPYFSNFMLSAARATVVVLRLDHVDGVAPSRLESVGFGSTHPVATNATAAGRAMNRRVDIVVDAERAAG